MHQHGGFPGGFPGGVPMRMGTEALPLLRVTGEGRLEVEPDTAEVTLGVSVRAAEAAAAYQQTAALLNQVVRALVDFGLKPAQMQSDRIALHPIYEKQQLTAYEGIATLRVTLRDLSAVAAVIDRAVAAGASRVQGVSFEVRETGPHEASALALAVQHAQFQALALSRALAIRPGPVWRVEAEPAAGPIFPALARTGAEAISVLPGTVSLTRRVQVEYVLQS